MRRLAQLGVWVGAVLGTTLVIAIATSVASDSDVTLSENEVLAVRPPPVPGKPDPPDPGARSATQAPGRAPAPAVDRTAALALARNDVVLRQILGSTAFRVVESQPWTTADLEPLGIVLRVELDTPITGSFRLPGVRFNPDGASYQRLMLNARVTGAKSLDLLVDLRSDRVVSVMPPDSTLSELPGNKHFAPRESSGG